MGKLLLYWWGCNVRDTFCSLVLQHLVKSQDALWLSKHPPTSPTASSPWGFQEASLSPGDLIQTMPLSTIAFPDHKHIFPSLLFRYISNCFLNIYSVICPIWHVQNGTLPHDLAYVDNNDFLFFPLLPGAILSGFPKWKTQSHSLKHFYHLLKKFINVMEIFFQPTATETPGASYCFYQACLFLSQLLSQSFMCGLPLQEDSKLKRPQVAHTAPHGWLHTLNIWIPFTK